MRIIVQRVSQAGVEVNGQIVNQIGRGLLVYLSIAKGDSIADAEFISDKIINLRIFADENGKMNRSVIDEKGEVLLISNFTLHGDCRKGRRPGFDAAAEPDLANELYEKVSQLIEQQGVTIKKGIFAAHMQITSINDGPLNFLLDSTKLF